MTRLTRTNRKFTGWLLTVTTVLLYTSPPTAFACSRIMWSDNGHAIVVGRTMDWVDSTEPELWVFPRGIQRHGRTKVNPQKWASKYGSLVTSGYSAATVDGINDKRLAGHLLYLREADYGKRDPQRPALSSLMWLQYILDSYASVEEAVQDSNNWHIELGTAGGHKATVHIAIEDITGDSAVFEFINGKLVVHHGPQYTVLTNSPPYDQQLEHIEQHVGLGGNKPLPGDILSNERFVRASYFLKNLPKPSTLRETVAGVMSVTRNVSVPFGAPYDQFSSYPTIYRTITDVTNARYYWEYTQSPNLFWIDLANLNFAENGFVMRLEPSNLTLAGEVSQHFHPVRVAPY
ncbi:MAG: linear amide C-N hydrolase [Candidatus Methylomirabilales bacterium]